MIDLAASAGTSGGLGGGIIIIAVVLWLIGSGGDKRR